MTQNLRIWRVVPTSKTGVQAPTFFVETTEEGREKAEQSAIKQARQRSGLGVFQNWNFSLTKMEVRVDRFGRYVKHHQ
jgi:hypothetical protein